MTIHRFRRSIFLAGAASLTALPAAAGAADPIVVNVGMVPLDIDGVVSYAQDLGYYQTAGLDVRLTMLASGPAIANAVIGHSLDIGAANVGSIILARARGIPLKLIAPAGIAVNLEDTEPIDVRKDSPIRTGANLNGKTIGINAVKTLQHAAVLLWIDKHGGDSKTVRFIEMTVSEMPAALDSGRVDAVLPGEPFTTMMRVNSRSLDSQYASMKLPIPVFGIFSTDDWLAAHGDVAAKFVGAVRRAALYSNAHHNETAPMLMRLTKVDSQLATTMGRMAYGTNLDAATLQPIIDVLLQYGMLAKPIDANDVLWQGPSK
jgi:NitT/TauT family transport system substrate-binding protein